MLTKESQLNDLIIWEITANFMKGDEARKILRKKTVEPY